MSEELRTKLNSFSAKRRARKKWLTVVASLCAVVAVGTSYVLINPATTLQQETYCGQEEHVHTDACYEGDYDHLVCESPVHEHSLQCFSNPAADVETPEDWKGTVADVEHSGNWSADVVAIAQSQLGYTESTDNYKVQADGTSMNGYTRYGEWYGDPYGDWSAMFCSFCLHYAGVDPDLMPSEADCAAWVETLSACNGFSEAVGQPPNPGDLIFFDGDNDGSADSVGIVLEVTEATETESAAIRTIEGDKDGSVDYGSYTVKDEAILGYGVLPVNPDEGDNVGGHVTVMYEAPKQAPLKAPAAKTAAKGGSAMLLGAGEEETTTPLKVEDYIPTRVADEKQAVILEYQDADGEWIDVTTLASGQTIPGDAKLRLNVEFEKVKITDLQAKDYQMTFTLPKIMRNPTVSAMITSGIVEVGTLDVDGDTVTLTFNKEWVDSQQMYKDDTIAYVAADNAFKLTVENNKGATLPETGGIGTTLFYTLGGILVLGAGVMLITKKRVGENG